MNKDLKKRTGVLEINLPALQRIVNAHLLPATIETMKPEDWEWIVQTIDKELTLARQEGLKSFDAKAGAQCPECRFVFPVDLVTLKNIVG
jgi:hypothetical protein